MTNPAPADVVGRIVDRVRAGYPVRRAIREEGSDPWAFYAAVNADDETRQRYARAKADGIDAVVDEMIEIADNPDLDGDQRRAAIDVRKFYAAKLAPKVYGDKLELDAKLSVGDAVIDRLARARSDVKP